MLALFLKIHEEQLAACGKARDLAEEEAAAAAAEEVGEVAEEREAPAVLEARRLEVAAVVRMRIATLYAAQRATWQPFQAQLHRNLGLLAYLMKIQ